MRECLSGMERVFGPFGCGCAALVYADRDRPASGHGLAEACAKSKLRPCQRIVDKFRRILLLCRITIGRFQG